MAIFDDLEQIAALGGAEDGQAPVVENEQLDASERLQEPTVTAVAAGERERFEQARTRWYKTERLSRQAL